MNAGPAIQRLHGETGIVGQGGQTAGQHRGMGLEDRIFGEGSPGFLRFGEAELGGRGDFHAKRGKQVNDFPHLARIVAGDDQPFLGKTPRHPGRRRTGLFKPQRLAL